MGFLASFFLIVILVLFALFLLLLLSGFVGAIMITFNDWGWLHSRRPTIIWTTVLLILVPMYYFASQYFQTQSCLNDNISDLEQRCGGGIGGLMWMGIGAAMILLSFIVGPYVGNRLYRHWTIETE